MINIGIFATTYSGNKGAAAMLCSIVDYISDKYEDSFFNIFSVYPEEDKKQALHNNVNIISTTPQEIFFIIFPLAILFRFFHRSFLKSLILKNKSITSYYESDFIIDAAGISFMDSRGFLMNTYNFVCMCIPLLLNKPVMKFSQAMGPINKSYNKIYAQIVLPKIEIICARGKQTAQYLNDINIKNFNLCSDGAFKLKEKESRIIKIQEQLKKSEFINTEFVTISISSVVYKYCNKNQIDYMNIMKKFISYLIIDKKMNVFLLANAARKDSTKLKNNDLPLCNEIMKSFSDNSKILFYNRELTPYEIWYLIGKSKVLIGSRFHAMIAALYNNVPVLLIGWSHKYKEILQEFNLENSAIEFQDLSFQLLINSYKIFMTNYNQNIEKINNNKPLVIESASKNYNHIDHMIIKYSSVLKVIE